MVIAVAPRTLGLPAVPPLAGMEAGPPAATATGAQSTASDAGAKASLRVHFAGAVLPTAQRTKMILARRLVRV
jgi:hypothetical protein